MSTLRFLVDVNVGLVVAESLRDAGHDVVFAADLDPRMPDEDILSVALSDKRVVVTVDTDFGNLVHRSRQSHAGILLLRMPGASRREKVPVVEEIVNRFGDQLPGRFCVYRQGRLRVGR